MACPSPNFPVYVAFHDSERGGILQDSARLPVDDFRGKWGPIIAATEVHSDFIHWFVDPLGRAYAATQLGRDTVVADRLRTSDVITLYVRWGDWVGTLVVLATLGFGVVVIQSAIHNRQSAIP